MPKATPAPVEPGSIRAQVSNFRGVTRADIDMKGVTLIAGNNGMGKTSLLQAIAAGLTNQAVPFFKADKPDSALLTKKNAGLLVHTGSTVGSAVRITTTDGKNQINWPDLDMKSEGKPPLISKVAAGLISPIDMPDAMRAQYFSQLLRTTPSLDELVVALADPAQVGLKGEKDGDGADNDQPIIDAVRERVDVGGFDGAHKHFSEYGTKTKGRWEQATGQRFGTTRTDFKPEAWDADMADHTEEQFAEAIALARERVTKATGKAAVDDAAMAAAETNAKKEPAAKAVLAAAQTEHASAKTCLEAAVTDLDNNIVPKGVPCPHCGAALTLKFAPGVGMSVDKLALSEKDIEKMERARAGLEKARDDANARMAKANDALLAAQESYATYKGAPAALKALKAQAAEAGGDKDALLAAEQDVANLAAKAEANKVKALADKLHRNILLNMKILDVLSPDGLRKTKLKSALEAFNAMLHGLCESASFADVVMNEDLEVTFNGVPHFMCSASELWRLKLIVQIAVAVKESACMVIIDGADILDSAGRNGLFGLLNSIATVDESTDISVQSLVAMTISKIEQAPALEKMEWGATAWMVDGAIEVTK